MASPWWHFTLTLPVRQWCPLSWRNGGSWCRSSWFHGISWKFIEFDGILTLENVVYALVNVVAPSEYDLQNLHVCYFKSSVWYLEIRCPQIKRRKNASGLVNVPIKHQPTKWGHLPTPWFFPLKLPFVRSILHSWTNLSTFRDFGANLWTCPKMGGIPDINDSIKKENADRLSNLAGI